MIRSFLAGNMFFESSAPLHAALRDIAACETLNEAFVAALRHKLLSVGGALKLALFLREGIAHGRGPAAAAAFDANRAMHDIGRCYDLAMRHIVWAHVGGGSGSDGKDGDDDEELFRDYGEDGDSSGGSSGGGSGDSSGDSSSEGIIARKRDSGDSSGAGAGAGNREGVARSREGGPHVNERAVRS